MRKTTIFSLTAIFSLSAALPTGCSGADKNTSVQSAAESSQTEEAMSNVQENPAEQTKKPSESDADSTGSNILIAYFAVAENSGVDAASSASYSVVNGEAKGRMRALADMIQIETGGDLFSIQTSVVYPSDGGALVDYADEEQNDDARPELTSHIENLDNYDTIFVGFPTWWYDMPQIMYSFFDEYDFNGKTIIPFNSHNGSGFSGTIETIQELEPNATVITDGFTVNERDVPESADDITAWLDGLDY